jgi:L-2,3-diaminopropanoate---citrate ligase
VFTSLHNKSSLYMAKMAEVQRLLNSYLREKEIFDPRIINERNYLSLKKTKDGALFRLLLEQIGYELLGYFSFWSATGHHEYEDTFYLKSLENETWMPANADEVMNVIVEELAFLEKDAGERSRKKLELRSHMENSIHKTALYLKNSIHQKGRNQEKPVFLQSEQSLLLGHPFHPTPKSSEGFSEYDLHLYAPELGASFTLHYFAVAKDLIFEEFIDGNTLDFGDEFTEEEKNRIRSQIGEEHHQYRLLPLHPWQANYVKTIPFIKKWIETKKIIDLGKMGRKVYPTASVRTVWVPARNFFYKLPLHIRITNFIRTNTLEQIRRTIDASRVIKKLLQQDSHSSFGILLEHGFRTISSPMLTEKENEMLIQNTAVLLREGPAELNINEHESLYVVASLLENLPNSDCSILAQQIRQYNHNGEEWLRQYLHVTLKPILCLFAEKGISLEAHAQNSLIILKNGWPEKCYVRDLEGISISREHAEKLGYFSELIEKESPVIYSDQEAWKRFIYYFFVNHLSHVVSSLAKINKLDEYQLWTVVRNFLLEMETETDSDMLKRAIYRLLDSPFLPAKANLISRFLERGETPLYVHIPNPIYRNRGESHESR